MSTFSSWSPPITKSKSSIDDQEINSLYVSGDKTLAFDVYKSYIGDSANTYEFGTSGDTILFDEASQKQTSTDYSLVTRTKYPRLFKTPTSFVWWYN